MNGYICVKCSKTSRKNIHICKLTYSVMSCNDMLGRVQVHVKDMFMSIAPNIIYLGRF